MPARIAATAAARRAIAGLRDTWGPVMFVQLASCCGDTSPMCYPAEEFPDGDEYLALGEVAGCPFHIDPTLYRDWREPRLVLDVAPGTAEGFSLPPGPGLRFIVRASTPEPAHAE